MSLPHSGPRAHHPRRFHFWPAQKEPFFQQRCQRVIYSSKRAAKLIPFSMAGGRLLSQQMRQSIYGRHQSFNFNQKCRSKHHSNMKLRHCLNHCCTCHRGRRQLGLQPASARRSSLAQIATAAFASSSNFPIKMKPWIWRSKQICVTRLPALLSACE